MGAIRINHVSVQARDLGESARFYTELFGLEPVPTPDFGTPVQWLRLGPQQLHLFQADGPAPLRHHLALDVDDFSAVYRRAAELGILDGGTFGAALRHHPTGWVQMYLRDPAGNLVEVNCPDMTTLDADVQAASASLAEAVPQTGDAARATLYLPGEGASRPE
jgi:catechol 2,3-dioxygenase-like lactoylglutathione lyase family enzyme